MYLRIKSTTGRK